MANKDDWRLRGQEEYMMNMSFVYKKFVPQEVGEDHTHCEFCWHKFMENAEEVKDASEHGYCSSEQEKWVCEECFEDFKQMFNWKIEK